MVEAAAPAPKSRGIDYSKFDKIEDSDDEKEQASSEPSKVEAEKPTCKNCHKDIVKPLRCGACKQVSYCSAQCQREDWPYHKRTCKKPEPAKAEPERRPSPPAGEKSEGKPKKEPEMKRTNSDSEDEKLTWYRHREWKPTSEPKREFKPTAITGEQAGTATEAAKPTAGSEWNAAGTWEEKDVTSWAQSTLKEQLQGLPDIDAAGGAISVTDVTDVEGDASKPVIRGKMRHLFDLTFKVKVEFKWMDSSGQQNLEGDVAVADFTNDVFAEGADSEPVVKLALKKGVLDMGRQQAVEAAIGAGVWPPSPNTLMAHVAARMEAWAKDYEKKT